MKISSVVVLIMSEEKRSLVRVGEEKLSQSGATTPTGGVSRHLFSFDILFVLFIFLSDPSPIIGYACHSLTHSLTD